MIRARQEELDALHARVFGTDAASDGKNENGRRHDAMGSSPPLADEAVLARCRDAANAAKFRALWAGDTTGHGGDDSAADLALLSQLSFWTQDPDQLDRLFRRSGLMREKWERADYRERTIALALNRDETWEPAGAGPRLFVGGHAAGGAAGADDDGAEASTGGADPPTGHPASPWPVLAAEALHGLAGDVVRALDPHTEGDPAATLVNYLLMVGSAVGATPHVVVSERRHYPTEFAVLTGPTSKGRKGTSHDGPLAIVGEADPGWLSRVMGGLSSGEGLIWAIRDPIEQTKKGETFVTDPGVSDKRLLAVEEEFSAVCRVATRDGNTLSETIRRAWDGKPLGNLTKNSPARCATPHVSMLAHVTRAELLRVMDSTDAANGFGNRFLWVCVRRSKELPEGGRLPAAERAALVGRTHAALMAARKLGEVRRDATARDLWAEVYHDLSSSGVGLFGSMTDRAEAHVLRLSLLYALVDGAPAISAAHTLAALALWDYCAASARHTFGDALGDPDADRILAALRGGGALDQTQLSDLFGRHAKGPRLGRALAALLAAGKVRTWQEGGTGGRHRTWWAAT